MHTPIKISFLENLGFEKNDTFMSYRKPLEPLREFGSRTFLVVTLEGEAWIEIYNLNVHRQIESLQSPAFEVLCMEDVVAVFDILTNKPDYPQKAFSPNLQINPTVHLGKCLREDGECTFFPRLEDCECVFKVQSSESQKSQS